MVRSRGGSKLHDRTLGKTRRKKTVKPISASTRKALAKKRRTRFHFAGFAMLMMLVVFTALEILYFMPKALKKHQAQRFGVGDARVSEAVDLMAQAQSPGQTHTETFGGFNLIPYQCSIEYSPQQGWYPYWLDAVTAEQAAAGMDGYCDFYPMKDAAKYASSMGTVDKEGKPIKVQHHELLTMVRIPKTGSTSLLDWMTLPHSKDGTIEHLNDKYARTNKKLMNRNKCLFIPKDLIGSHYPSSTFKGGSCLNINVDKTVEDWIELTRGYSQNYDVRNTNNHRYTLQFFTILRDPFERLVSYFHYANQVYPAWSSESTPPENARIEAGDMTGWLQTMASQNEKYLLHSRVAPYQLTMVGSPDQLNVTLSMIQRYYLNKEKTMVGMPPITPLLAECYDASIALMQTVYPQYVLDAETAGDSQERRWIQRQPGGAGTDIDRAVWRKKAIAWFWEDYIFYHVAAHEFNVLLENYGIDASMRDQCRTATKKRFEEDARALPELHDYVKWEEEE